MCFSCRGFSIFCVQADNLRVKAVASLGDFSVLNLLRPPQFFPPLGVSSTSTATLSSRPKITSDMETESLGDCMGDGSSVWADPVIGRGKEAVGPVLDVAVVVSSCGDSRSPPEQKGRVPVKSDSACGGLQARAKIQVDKVRTALSIPFIENLTRHVLTGPLASYLLREDVAKTPGHLEEVDHCSTSRPPVSATASVSGTQRAATGEGSSWAVGESLDTNNAPRGGSSSSWGSAEGAPARHWEGSVGNSQQTGENLWKEIIFIEVCTILSMFRRANERERG